MGPPADVMLMWHKLRKPVTPPSESGWSQKTHCRKALEELCAMRVIPKAVHVALTVPERQADSDLSQQQVRAML